jgi:carboxymethylenebutenolidase
MHFGAQDQGIPLSNVETVRTKRPDAEIYIYDDAGHGFHCDERGAYHKPSADIAWGRTMEFLKKN